MIEEVTNLVMVLEVDSSYMVLEPEHMLVLQAGSCLHSIRLLWLPLHNRASIRSPRGL